MASYKVQGGDTMIGIAKKKGIPYGALVAANPQIDDPAKIRAGATIRLPSKKQAASMSQAQIQAGINKVFYDEAGNLRTSSSGAFVPKTSFQETPGAEYKIPPTATWWQDSKKENVVQVPKITESTGTFGMPPDIASRMRARAGTSTLAPESSKLRFGGDYTKAIEWGKQWQAGGGGVKVQTMGGIARTTPSENWLYQGAASRPVTRQQTSSGGGTAPGANRPSSAGGAVGMPGGMSQGQKDILQFGYKTQPSSVYDYRTAVEYNRKYGPNYSAGTGRVPRLPNGDFDYRTYVQEQKMAQQKLSKEWQAEHPEAGFVGEQTTVYDMLILGRYPSVITPNAAKIASDADWLTMGYYKDEFGYWRRLPEFEGTGGGGDGAPYYNYRGYLPRSGGGSGGGGGYSGSGYSSPRGFIGLTNWRVLL